MELLSYFLLLFFIIACIFLSVDAYFWWMERFPRYKIGRNRDFDSWSKALFEKGKSWLPKVPAVPITQNKHLLLWDILQGKFTRNSVQAWQTGGLLLGVSEYSPEESKTLKQKTIDFFIDQNGNWKTQPKNVDFAILAYSFLKNHPHSNFLKPAMDEVIAVINNQICEDGLIAYSGRKNIRYVDTLGLVCPFLVLYDNNYQTNKYAALAVSQIEKFVEFGMFKDSFLPVHSYEVNTGFPVGVFGWGRGTGWFILGVLDSYLELKDGQLKERLEKILRETAAYYLQFQREDGGFGIFIQDKNTYDSSATAVFAYFYAKCFQIFGNAEYFRSLEKSLEKLVSFTRRDGSLDYCQGDTVEVGVFSQRLDIMPFAQGMLLRAVKIYENNRSEK